jgi:ABC-type proline/glycine betaine transport system permease subunit
MPKGPPYLITLLVGTAVGVFVWWFYLKPYFSPEACPQGADCFLREIPGFALLLLGVPIAGIITAGILRALKWYPRDS